METISIAPSVVNAMVDHARREAPNECCGLLVGDARRIERAVGTRNVRASTTRYLIDPHEHFALIRLLRGTAHEIVGAYHSHPSSPAVPSATDLADAISGDFVYVIVSLTDPNQPIVKAYRLVEGQAHALTIVSG